MAILTKVGNPIKGTPYSVQLNKVDLLANAVVQADAYFISFDHWKYISVNYKSTTGNQSAVLKFDATQNTPTFSITFSDVALGSFEVDNIIIQDFDNGYLVIPRSSLTTAEFDLTVEAPQLGFTRTFNTGQQSWEYIFLDGAGSISHSPPVLVWDEPEDLGLFYYVDLVGGGGTGFSDNANYLVEIDYVNLSYDQTFAALISLGNISSETIDASMFAPSSGTVSKTINGVSSVAGYYVLNLSFVVQNFGSLYIEIQEIRVTPL